MSFSLRKLQQTKIDLFENGFGIQRFTDSVIYLFGFDLEKK